MERSDDRPISSINELFLDIGPSDGSNAEEKDILEEFHAFMRQPSTQNDLEELEQLYDASTQFNHLHRKYREVIEGLNESEKLEGDCLTLKQIIVRAIVTIYPFLNHKDKHKFVYALKACKIKVTSGQKYNEGKAIFHGANGRRQPLFGNRAGDKFVYIRKMQLSLLGLNEIELSQHSGEYGALCFETAITILNMLWNKTGCINRNINAVTGWCKERINTVCLLVIDMEQLQRLHNGTADVKDIPNIRPVLNSSWDDNVNQNIRRVASWLPQTPAGSSIHYESQAELAMRLKEEGITYQPRRRRVPSVVSSDDDDKDDTEPTSSKDNASITCVTRIENDIRTRRGNELFSKLRSERIKNRTQVFKSHPLCRSTIMDPTSRQIEFDTCLNVLDVDLLRHQICSASSFTVLVDSVRDLLNREEVLHHYESFESREFDHESGDLYTPLLEVCINVNHANTGDNEMKSTFFMNLWYAHEYRQEHCPNDEYVIVKRVVMKRGANAEERLLKNLDSWLEWISGTRIASGSYGRDIEPNTIESTLLSMIGICHDNSAKYLQQRTAVRDEASRKRLREREESKGKDSKQCKDDADDAFRELFG